MLTAVGPSFTTVHPTVSVCPAVAGTAEVVGFVIASTASPVPVQGLGLVLEQAVTVLYVTELFARMISLTCG